MVKQQPRVPGHQMSKRERSALLSYALFRWESAVTLAMTLILAVFVPDPFRGAVSFWGAWVWIALGVLAEALIVLTTLSDPDVRVRIVGQLIRARFGLDAIADVDLRQRIAKSIDTREQMEAMLQRTRDRTVAAQLGVIADAVSDWIAALYALAQRIDHDRNNTVLRRNRGAIPNAIRTLESQLARTTGPEARAEIERALAARRAEWTQVEHLDKLVESAISELDDSQGALETMYTEMQLIAARSADGHRVEGRVVEQMRGEITDHTRSLSEIGQEIVESVNRS
jgi:hypothetical protein